MFAIAEGAEGRRRRLQKERVPVVYADYGVQRKEIAGQLVTLSGLFVVHEEEHSLRRSGLA